MVKPSFKVSWERLPSEVPSERMDVPKSGIPTCMQHDKAFFDAVFEEELGKNVTAEEGRDDEEDQNDYDDSTMEEVPLEPAQFHPGSPAPPAAAPAPAIKSSKDGSPSHSPVPVDLMQVSVTIYDLKGLFLVDRKKKKLARKAKKNNLGAPSTTAVVSCARQSTKSNAPIETYLPSLPFDVKEDESMKASWPKADCQLLTGMDELVPSTFKMIRPMKRVAFDKNNKVPSQVNNYEHDTIDLTVSAGQGKNLESIGKASFVVTGEEESEVVHNVLIRPIPFDQRKKTGKKIVVDTSTGPKRFALGETAVLRVGVRLLPERDIMEATRRIAKAEDSHNRTLQEILDTMMSDHYVVNVNGTEEMLQQIIENQLQRLQEDHRKEEKVVTQLPVQTVVGAGSSSEGSVLDFFIGMFEMCTPSSHATAVVEIPVTTDGDNVAAPVAANLSMFSSVSGSHEDAIVASTGASPSSERISF